MVLNHIHFDTCYEVVEACLEQLILSLELSELLFCSLNKFRNLVNEVHEVLNRLKSLELAVLSNLLVDAILDSVNELLGVSRAILCKILLCYEILIVRTYRLQTIEIVEELIILLSECPSPKFRLIVNNPND